MPGFGNPLELPITDFFPLMRRARLVGRVARGEADEREILELEDIGHG